MAYNVCGGNGDQDDLLSVVIEELLNADQEKINTIIQKKQITFYIARIMMNQYYSKTSRYYYEYRKYYELAVTEINNEITKSSTDDNDQALRQEYVKKIQKVLDNCHWFDRQIFKLYYMKDHSLNSLAKVTKIDRNTIYHTINRVKKFLKNL